MTKSPEPPQLSDRDELGPNDLDRQRVRARIEKALALGMFSDTALRVDHLMDEQARLATRGSLLGLAKVVLPTLVLGVTAGALWGRQQPSAPPQAAEVQTPARGATAGPTKSSGHEPGDERPLDTGGAPPSAAGKPDDHTGAAAASNALAKRRGPAPVKDNHNVKAGAREHTDIHEQAAAPAPAQAEAAPLEIEPERAPAPVAARHLAEELRLMRAASAALDAENYAEARRLLHDHEQRFAHGALAQERRALELIALCKQGQARTVHAQLTAFLQAETASPLARRVRQACEPAR
jgi:hypothetical protein